MMRLYNATHGRAIVSGPYIGTDREELSALLGGPVGFGYIGKTAFGNAIVTLDDDCPLVVSLTHEDIPRRDYPQLTFAAALAGAVNPYTGMAGRYWIGRAADWQGYAPGEVAFLAEMARIDTRSD